MPSFVVPIQYIYNDRLAVVRDFLRPLKGGREVPCTFVPSQASKGIVIATRDERNASREYTDWRFKAELGSDIWYQYYEIWRQLENTQECVLFRAYFHVFFKTADHKLKQVACLHCDPDEEPASDSEVDMMTCTYKRGPHLHVLSADDPMPTCHFPLNLGHLNDVLASADALTRAMNDGMNLLHFEIVKRPSLTQARAN